MCKNWVAGEAAANAHLAAVGAHESSSEDEDEGNKLPTHRPICPAEEDAVKLVRTLSLSVLMSALTTACQSMCWACTHASISCGSG